MTDRDGLTEPRGRHRQGIGTLLSNPSLEREPFHHCQLPTQRIPTLSINKTTYPVKLVYFKYKNDTFFALPGRPEVLESLLVGWPGNPSTSQRGAKSPTGRTSFHKE